MFRNLTAALLLVAFAGMANAQIYVQEFCADPNDGVTIDTNGDGVMNSSEDEFIEFTHRAVSMPGVDVVQWVPRMRGDLFPVQFVVPRGVPLAR